MDDSTGGSYSVAILRVEWAGLPYESKLEDLRHNTIQLIIYMFTRQ